jgi:lysophospholipase L1-like esterase
MAITITALGDSTTWGYNSGNQVQNNMVTTAQEELSKALKSPVDIINRGQNATTLGDAISNGNLYAAASDPSNVVILNYGMNEAYRRVNPEQFRQNLLDAAGYLQSLGKTVVLQTPNFTANPDIPNVDVYANVIRDVAGQYGLAVDDKYSATQSAEFSQNDLTHPTAQVYQQLGRSLASTLQPIVSGQSQAATQQPLAAQSPEGLLSTAAPSAPAGQQFSGLFESGDVLANQAQEVLAASGRANDPRFADAIVGSFTQNGITYNVQGDGSIQGFIETPTGAYLSAGFTPTGQQATEELSSQFEQTSTDRLLGTLANAAIAAGTAAGLGPAGVGLMSVPAAAATGAGFTTFANSGDLAQALRAAALAGTTAFGIEQLFPSAVQTAAKTATDLAQAGASQAEIATALVDQGVRAGTAASMASDALAGASASQIASDFAGIAIGGTTAASTSLAPNVVEVLGSTAAPGLLATAAPSLAGAAGGLLGTAQVPAQQAPAVVAQTVPVTSSAAPVELQSIAPAAAGGLLAPTQTVPVQAATTPAQTQATTPAAAAVGGLLTPTQTVPVQATNIQAQTQTTAPTAAAVGTLAPTQTVPVESRTIKTETPSILAPAAATVITTPRGEVPVTTYEVPRSSTGPIEGSTTINPLLALGLLGLAGTALAGGGSTGAPVDQAAYDAIARGRSPVYPRGQFTPISLGGLPGMGGMGEIGAYDYFGPYYGAGRFGARPQAFALPGLLGPQMMSIPTTPSRSAAV